MNIIKISLLAGALAAVGGGAAVAAQPQPPAGGPRADVTRDQALARADQRFQRMDANRDGRVTAEELRQLAEARRAGRQERRAERRAHRFDRLDANRDGQISREEFSQRPERAAQAGEPGGRRGMRNGRGGGQFAMRGLGVRMLGEDGVMTAEEFRHQALQRFERADSNRDGRVTAEERREGRDGQRRDRRGAAPRPGQN